MMRWNFRWVAGLAAAVMAVHLAGSGAAQQAVPSARIPLEANADLPGGDLGPIFNISQTACMQACLASADCTHVTYNANARACFPKANPGAPVFYDGAFSGAVMRSDPALLAGLDDRIAQARGWLTEADLRQAREMADSLGELYPGDGRSPDEMRADVRHLTGFDPEAALRMQAAVTAQSDLPADWLALAQRMNAAGQARSGDSGQYFRQATAAITNAWLRAPGAAGTEYLVEWALQTTLTGREREGLAALRHGPRDDNYLRGNLEEFEHRYGFRVADSRLEESGSGPRYCISFSEDVARDADLHPYVSTPVATIGIDVADRDLCLSGLERGTETTVVLRAGLPSQGGGTLGADVSQTAYIPDQKPGVRFAGRAYVLPASGDLGLTIHSVNTPEIGLRLYRMSDRNLVSALRDEIFGNPLQGWREEIFTGQLGQQVWQGTATIAPPAGGGSHPVNTEVATRLDLRAEAGPLEPGIYALMADVPGSDPDIAPPASQWFMVSDLGLSSFSGTDGLTVAVRGLSDAGARAGIEVALISRGNAVLGTVLSDAQGIAHFDAGLTRGRDSAEPAMITATRLDGDTIADLSFLSLSGPEFDLSDRGVEGNPAAPPVDVFATLDRGAYRAGETAHATILARDNRAAAIDGLPMSARILRPDGAEHARLMATAAGAGGYVLDLPIPATAPRGAWRIELRVESDGPPLASLRMLVEDFLPERLDFTLELPAVLDGAAPVSAHIDARWLFGAPAAELPVEGEIIATPARRLPDWPGYVFGRHDDLQPQGGEMIAGHTDEAGGFDLLAALPEALTSASRPWDATLRLRVLEGAGRPVERVARSLILPPGETLGLRPDFPDETVNEGTNAAFSAVMLGPDGAPRDGVITWQLNRIETDYQWYSLGGSWQWEAITRRQSVTSGRQEANAEGPVSLSVPVDWGQYEMVLRNEDGAETSFLFWAGWGAASGSGGDTPDRLRVTLDKPAYRAGENAIATFEASAAGTALISVMSNRLVSLQAVAAQQGMNSVTLPVTDEWGAGVYVAVSMIRPLDAGAGHAPVRALGLAPAVVDPGARLLEARIDAPAQHDPRGTAEVTLHVAGAGAGQQVHATIWAVDQGILNLTGYKPPSAGDHYFGQRRLGVGLRDLYGQLILASGAADGALRSGGDAGSASLAAPPPTEKLMSWFSGPVTLDAGGKASVSVPLPDFNGEVRLIALVWTDTAVGQADATMLVRDPVVMTVTAPAFLAPGDQARAEIVLTHVSGPPGEVGLEIAPVAEGIALGARGLPAAVTLTEGQRLPLQLELSAPPDAQTAAAGIVLAATLPDGRRVTKELAIPVMRLDQPVTRAMRLTLAPGESAEPDFTALGDFVPGSGRITMASGAYALLDVPAALYLLRNFPYGCTEQVVSAMMPQLYLGALISEVPAQEMPGGAVTENIAKAVTLILTRQTVGGGFGLWAPDYSDDWLDAYATDFLSRARAQGHAVPDASFRRALVNLQNRLNAAPDLRYAGPDEAAAVAYAAYVLARERSAVVSDLRYYADTGADAFRTPMAAAQLGAALAYLGDQPRADRMFDRAAALLRAPDEQRRYRRDYGTTLRDRAATLALAAEAGTQRINREAEALRIATGFDNSSSNRWRSTQEALWLVLAGHALMTAEDAGQGLMLGQAAITAPITDLGDASAPMRQPLSNTGERPIDVILSATAVPEGQVSAGGNAFSITRSYYTPEGELIDPQMVTQGQRLNVLIRVRVFGNATGGRLIITDPLPAGFEIENPNLIESGNIEGEESGFGIPDTEMTEFRADRFAASLQYSGGTEFELAYRLRAVTAGSFRHPAATVSDFYSPDLRGWTDSGSVTITPAR